MRARLFLKLATAAALFSAGPLAAQDLSRIGGDLTSDVSPEIALELPAPNIRESQRIFHIDGHGDFHESFAFARSGGQPVVGPNFNHDACGGCHVKDGRGAIRFSKTHKGSAMLVKVSLRGVNEDGSPVNVPGVGEQLQDHDVDGAVRFGIKLRWIKVRGRFADGTRYTLRRPQLSFRIPNVDDRRVLHSLRMTPPVIGMGLLEAISDDTLRALSDPDDADGDGISGELNIVPDRETNAPAIGRFGFRASHPTVRQQSAAAFFNDMGMTSRLFGVLPGQAPEVPDDILERITFYQQAAGIPAARDQSDPDVLAGKEIFQELNCSGCHKMTLTSGDSPVPEVANQEFHPFTDLLLHDMGRDLADTRKEFSASGREWRTTPLWGLGLHDFISKDKPGFLHDGRARTIEEAILWHGGEAAKAREGYRSLQRTRRDQLIRFLRSL